MMNFFLFYLFFMILGLFSNFYSLFYFMMMSMIFFYFKDFYFLESFMESYYFSLDVFSWFLIILSLWLTKLMIFSSLKILNLSFLTSKVYLFLMLILYVVLFFTFLINDFFLFYFFFEISLIPTLMIIVGWGYQPERLQAGIYMIIYTIVGSLPLLLVIFFYFKFYGCLNMFNLKYLFNVENLFLCLMMISGFLVKLPMFFVHLWLPKAHVEAPVAGSMILAGVLLKLGGYGLYRLLMLGLINLLNYSSYFFGLSLVGMFFVGLICCRLNDLKALVAYSSVAHMGLVICGFFSMYYWGIVGLLLMMLAHGVSSSGLFCMVNLYYERSGSRSFFFNKGLLNIIPLLSLMFFLLCVSNIAAPPTLNLISEIFLMGSMIKFDYFMLLFFPLGSYLGAVFTLILFSYTQHGEVYISLMSFYYNSFNEYFLTINHIFPLNLFFLKFYFLFYF